jgi:hypothetical protein
VAQFRQPADEFIPIIAENGFPGRSVWGVAGFEIIVNLGVLDEAIGLSKRRKDASGSAALAAAEAADEDRDDAAVER